MSKSWRFDTQCVHSGEGVDGDTRAIRRPLHMANSFELPTDFEELFKTFSWEHADKYHYTREQSPTPRYLEERLATLEGSDDCIAAASGMGAVAATLFTLLNAGDHIVASEVCYTGTQKLLAYHFPRFGVDVSLVDTSDLSELKAALRPDTKVVYIETPGNPLMNISDIEAISKLAHVVGATVIVDSTWSGLVTQKPLELGADVVIHSATKYLNGHGDALGGAVLGEKKLMDQIREYGIVHLGACISPFNAWQIMRGLVTLPLRMEKHSDNAMKIAKYLESHPKVKMVLYPGLESHPMHKIAKRQMTAFSGMMNFAFEDDLQKNFDFLRNLKLITHAVSLGHDQSLILYMPGAFFFDEWVMLAEERQGKYRDIMGAGVYRFSIGIENSDDLIEDLDQALKSVN